MGKSVELCLTQYLWVKLDPCEISFWGIWPCGKPLLEKCGSREVMTVKTWGWTVGPPEAGFSGPSKDAWSYCGKAQGYVCCPLGSHVYTSVEISWNGREPTCEEVSLHWYIFAHSQYINPFQTFQILCFLLRFIKSRVWSYHVDDFKRDSEMSSPFANTGLAKKFTRV